jgi:outer membrane protein assembly factor BamB
LAPETAVATNPAESETAEKCSKHAQNPAAAHCTVCAKPICLDCMAQFGYLCSPYCKEMAERKKIPVPFYEHAKTALAAAETRKDTRFAAIVAGIAILLIGFVALYKFYLSKPKEAFAIEASQSSPWILSQWIPPGKLLLASANKVTLHDASSGKQLWAADVKARGSAANARGKVDGSDFWLLFPNRALRFEVASGKKTADVLLPEDATETSLGDEGYLTVAETTPGALSVSLLDLGSGKLDTVTLKQRSLKNRNLAIARAQPVHDSEDPIPECEHEFFLSDNSVVQMQSRMIEYRAASPQRGKARGPSILDSSNLHASQGTAAAEEFLNQDKGPTKEDQSRYAVTLKRVIGSGAAWSAEVVGAPVFFPLRWADLLAAGRTLYAFAKDGQKLWEAKLNVPVAPRFIRSEMGEIPAIESGGKIYFFDQSTVTAFESRTGDVKWRVQAAGTSQILPDSAGNLYIVSTTADPGRLNPSRDVELSNTIKPLLLKVNATTGATLWDITGIAGRVYISGKYLYASRSQISGLDTFSEAESHGDFKAPVHNRLYRLDPKNGNEIWEYYRPEPPISAEMKGTAIFLLYPGELRALKFFAF